MEIKPGTKVRMKAWQKIKWLYNFGINDDVRKKFAGRWHEVKGVFGDYLTLKNECEDFYWPITWFINCPRVKNHDPYNEI